jgi:CheY-like chemotaxis protein
VPNLHCCTGVRHPLTRNSNSIGTIGWERWNHLEFRQDSRAHKPKYDFTRIYSDHTRPIYDGFAAVEVLSSKAGGRATLSNVPVISIIDDDESVRVAMKSLMNSLGLVVHTFPSVEEFLQSPHMDETSCLIADVQMPGISGIELQSHLIAHGQYIPIVFITAYPEERLGARLLKAGAVGFLGKPFDEQTLLQYVDMALRRGRGDGTVR